MRSLIYRVSGVGCMMLMASVALQPSIKHTPLANRYRTEEIANRSKTLITNHANETDRRTLPLDKNIIQASAARNTSTLPGGFGPWHRNIPKKLYILAKEAFDVIPTSFLPGFKSPCFFLHPEDKTSLQCLPYFYLIGIQKCGTTDLWDKITSHPSIVRTLKEPHYWARNRVVRNESIHEYLIRQSQALIKGFANREAEKRELITCDGSTSALSDNSWQNMTHDPPTGPEFVVADIMGEIQPDSKHIIMLRNPVTRTYSDFRHFGVRKEGVTAENFHKYVKYDIERFDNCTKNHSPRACAYLLGRTGTRTLFSYYAIYVRDWLKVFPRDQLFILRTEDWRANCIGNLRDIYTFLDLDDLLDSELTFICNQEMQWVNPRLHGRPMLEETKQLLDNFFLEKNKELSRLLSDDRFLWK